MWLTWAEGRIKSHSHPRCRKALDKVPLFIVETPEQIIYRSIRPQHNRGCVWHTHSQRHGEWRRWRAVLQRHKSFFLPETLFNIVLAGLEQSGNIRKPKVCEQGGREIVFIGRLYDSAYRKIIKDFINVCLN